MGCFKIRLPSDATCRIDEVTSKPSDENMQIRRRQIEPVIIYALMCGKLTDRPATASSLVSSRPLDSLLLYS